MVWVDICGGDQADVSLKDVMMDIDELQRELEHIMEFDDGSDAALVGCKDWEELEAHLREQEKCEDVTAGMQPDDEEQDAPPPGRADSSPTGCDLEAMCTRFRLVDQSTADAWQFTFLGQPTLPPCIQDTFRRQRQRPQIVEGDMLGAQRVLVLDHQNIYRASLWGSAWRLGRVGLACSIV